MATQKQIDIVAKHYVIACLFFDSEEGTNPRATNQAMEKAMSDCAAFIAECGPLFDAAMNCYDNGYGMHPDAGSAEAAFGHDFWLTRNGHGSGFWDRSELGELGEQISALCGWHAGKRTKFTEANYEFYRGWLYLN